eukprot:Rmarinus@m.170
MKEELRRIYEEPHHPFRWFTFEGGCTPGTVDSASCFDEFKEKVFSPNAGALILLRVLHNNEPEVVLLHYVGERCSVSQRASLHQCCPSLLAMAKEYTIPVIRVPRTAELDLSQLFF